MKIIQIWFIMVCWKKRDTYGVEILIFSTLVDALLLVRPKKKKNSDVGEWCQGLLQKYSVCKVDCYQIKWILC